MEDMSFFCLTPLIGATWTCWKSDDNTASPLWQMDQGNWTQNYNTLWRGDALNKVITFLFYISYSMQKCNHAEIYQEIHDENLELMRERLMETVIWPSDDSNTWKIDEVRTFFVFFFSLLNLPLPNLGVILVSEAICFSRYSFFILFS